MTCSKVEQTEIPKTDQVPFLGEGKSLKAIIYFNEG
jgi:hypothetical protein